MTIVVKNRKVGIATQIGRLVCNLIRNKKASEAMRILRFNDKKEISLMLAKLISSGLAIASDSDKIDIDNLVVSQIFADDGPTLKRIQPRAQGRAFKIRKRSSHVTVELKEA